jgi:hypothetical protein
VPGGSCDDCTGSRLGRHPRPNPDRPNS